jgi:hypothetical protein
VVAFEELYVRARVGKVTRRDESGQSTASDDDFGHAPDFGRTPQIFAAPGEREIADNTYGVADVTVVVTREVNLSRLDSTLIELSYPVSREVAAETFDDLTVTFADGEANLGDLISETPAEEFDSFEELRGEINNTIPREAVGEPSQSEGEG